MNSIRCLGILTVVNTELIYVVR